MKFRDPATGRVKQESTRCRIGIGSELTKARRICAEFSVREQGASGVLDREQWDYWVEDFLRARHSASPKTRVRNLGSWANIRELLRERDIVAPRHLNRDHCFAYVGWRKERGHNNSRNGKKVKHNTVLLELKTLTKVLKEAVLRNYATSNPSLGLGLEKERVKQKPELTDEQIAVIRAEIQRKLDQASTPEERNNSHFFHVSFEIALAQGFRLAETHSSLNDIDERRMSVRVIPKGDEKYETELNPSSCHSSRSCGWMGGRTPTSSRRGLRLSQSDAHLV